MANSFQVVEEKLQETELFLDLLKSSNPRSFENRCYFSAFVSAARSVTFTLQFSMHGVSGFKDWYSGVQESLRADALAPHFVGIRNEIQKKGSEPT